MSEKTYMSQVQKIKRNKSNQKIIKNREYNKDYSYRWFQPPNLSIYIEVNISLAVYPLLIKSNQSLSYIQLVS